MRIDVHPVLGALPERKSITIYFENKPMKVYEGQTVAAALMDHQVYVLGYSRNLLQPRGCYCLNGRCQSCMMTINNIEHVRSCTTLVQDQMTIARENHK
jgi:sarcosine oxidase subunit alpha